MKTLLSFRRFYSVKPFEEIPGPRPLPLVGNVWRYLPVIGDYDLEKAHENGMKNFRKYGPIVRENLYGKTNLVHLFDPKDIETLFRSDGKYPQRRSHRALSKYRKDRPDLYSSGGLFPENGDEWYRLRKIVQGPMMNPQNVVQYVSKCDEVSEDFLQYIRRHRDQNSEMADFLTDLYRWALENVIQIIFNLRCGLISERQDCLTDHDSLVRCVHETIDAVMRTEVGSLDLWRFWDTPVYSKLVRAQDEMAQIILNMQKISERRLSNSSSDSETHQHILGHLMRDKRASKQDLFGITMDLLLAGIETTAIVTGFTLYQLAKHQTIQDQVREEMKSLLPSLDSEITSGSLERMRLLKACVKETLRLNPLSIGVGRIASEDIVIRNYHIPAGTMIITQNQVACLQESNFSEASFFAPERWLLPSISSSPSIAASPGTGLTNRPSICPFAYLPFGYGARLCVGRRIAEMEIYVLTAKLVRNYLIQYHHEDVGLKSRLINIPDKPLKLRFVDTND